MMMRERDVEIPDGAHKLHEEREQFDKSRNESRNPRE
jgi:hypothetical protein